MEKKYERDEMVTCCLCGKVIPFWQSANPWPVVDDENSRCCHDCNEHTVMPARWNAMFAPNAEPYPAFLEVGDHFLSMDADHFDENTDKATDYFYDVFCKLVTEAPDKVYQAILRKGFERIGADDSEKLHAWTGFLMGVKYTRSSES